MRELALGSCARQIRGHHSRKKNDEGQDDDQCRAGAAFKCLSLYPNIHLTVS
jgi:hypothetical protein